MKTQFAWLDMVVFGDRCNLRCQYCFGFDRLLGIAGAASKRPPDYVETHLSGARQTLERIEEVIEAPIVKFSGGEIFMHPEIDTLIEWAHDRYSIVQILTNGLRLGENQRIARLAQSGRIHMQISLDGHTPEFNAARADQLEIHRRIMANIVEVIEQGLPLEMNCILTRYNISAFIEYCRHFQRIAKGRPVTIVPRPVRGEPRGLLGAQPDGIDDLERFVQRYDEFQDVLPPRPYMTRLIEMLRHGRTRRCYIPYFVLGLESTGEVRSCTVGNMPVIGLASDPANVEIARVKQHYDAAREYQPCQDCINQYEMLNMFTDGVIDRNDLRHMAIYREPAVMAAVERVAERIHETALVQSK